MPLQRCIRRMKKKTQLKNKKIFCIHFKVRSIGLNKCNNEISSENNTGKQERTDTGMKKNIRLRRNIGFVLLTLALILVAGFCMGSVAMGQTKSTVRVNEQYYLPMETAYKEQVQTVLEEAGYVNAGIMLTHVREEDGTRIYTLKVHHKRLEKLDEKERESLSRALAACAFEGEGCRFLQEFAG